jgi:gliding motility-associated-like protein
VACYETATFNTTTCTYDITGTQPVAPTVACYETATFNTTTCTYDISGTQPVAPTVACYETTTFNTTTCTYDISGTQPVAPTVACYETATFNTTTCAYDITGTQPVAPTVACYETATFNTTTCTYDITGTQPEIISIRNTDADCNDDIKKTFDLNEYLILSNIPTNGSWSTDNTNVNQNLTGSTFSPYQVPVGDYIFKYTVATATCPINVELTMVVDDNCIVLDACSEIKIDVKNAFSPNGDNTNEVFFIANIDQFDCFPNNNVEIYNRWGVLVYETKQYDNETRVFTGTSEGRVTVDKSSQLPTGTYFYIINYTDKAGQTNHKEGYLYLTR